MPDGADSATDFEEYHKIAEAEHPASFLRSGIPARGYREPSVMIQSTTSRYCLSRPKGALSPDSRGT